MDLFIHQIAGFDVEKARQLYGIPEGYEPVAAIADAFLKRTFSGKAVLQID